MKEWKMAAKYFEHTVLRRLIASVFFEFYITEVGLVFISRSYYAVRIAE